MKVNKMNINMFILFTFNAWYNKFIKNFNSLAKDLHTEVIISNIIKTKLTRLLIYMIILNVNVLLTSSIIIFILIFKTVDEFKSNKKFITGNLIINFNKFFCIIYIANFKFYII